MDEASLVEKQPAIYILASHRNGTLSIGVTNDPIRRAWEHKQGEVEGFTKQYKIHLLVYYELHENMRSAIEREKQMKKWDRAWKMELIEKSNPQWRDLWADLTKPWIPVFTGMTSTEPRKSR